MYSELNQKVKNLFEENLSHLLIEHNLDIHVSSKTNYNSSYINSTERHTKDLPYRWYHYVFFPLGLAKIYENCLNSLFSVRNKPIRNTFHPPTFTITITPFQKFLVKQKSQPIEFLSEKDCPQNISYETILNPIKTTATQIIDFSFDIVSVYIHETKYKIENKIIENFHVEHHLDLQKITKIIEQKSKELEYTIQQMV